MSISSEITRISNAKSAIAQSIAGKGVTVPSGTKIDGMAPLINSIQTVDGLVARTTVNLTTGALSVGDYAFYNYTGLKTFDGNAVMQIGQHAFDGCTGITAVSLPAGITSIGAYAFNYLGYERTNYSTQKLTLDLLDGAFTTAAEYSFGHLRNAGVYFPSAVTQIGANAFAGCEGLDLYLSGTAPALDANAFADATDYAVYVLWENGSGYATAEGWSELAGRITGIAKAGTFTAGETLPKISGVCRVTWYTDAEKTNVATVCPDGSPMLYCSYTVLDKLDAPVIAMNEDNVTLEITDVENATSYDIYVDGVYAANVLKPIKLAEPTDIALTGDTLTWNNVENNNGYEIIYRRTDGAGEIYQTDNVAKDVTTHTLTVTAVGVYSVTIIALGECPYVDSDESAASTYTVLEQLATPAIAMNEDAVTLEITDVDNAASYDLYVDETYETNVTKGE